MEVRSTPWQPTFCGSRARRTLETTQPLERDISAFQHTLVNLSLILQASKVPQCWFWIPLRCVVVGWICGAEKQFGKKKGGSHLHLLKASCSERENHTCKPQNRLYIKNWRWMKRLWIYCKNTASFVLPQYAQPEGALLAQTPRKQVAGKHSSFILKMRQQAHRGDAWFPCRWTEIQWLAGSGMFIFQLQSSLLKHQHFLFPAAKNSCSGIHQNYVSLPASITGQDSQIFQVIQWGTMQRRNSFGLQTLLFEEKFPRCAQFCSAFPQTCTTGNIMSQTLTDTKTKCWILRQM